MQDALAQRLRLVDGVAVHQALVERVREAPDVVRQRFLRGEEVLRARSMRTANQILEIDFSWRTRPAKESGQKFSEFTELCTVHRSTLKTIVTVSQYSLAFTT